MEIIDQNTINEIRQSVDIVDIISGYLPLTPHGKNYFGVCPFHNDTNPSMSVSQEKQIFKCFSCGEYGNVFSFVQKYENISFIEAVSLIASKAGINLDIKSSFVKKDENIVLHEIYDLSLKLYQNNINTKQGIKAKEYLKIRKIDDEIIKEFEIGLSLKKRNLLTDLLVNKGYNYNDILETGLIIKNEYGYNDIYYNRIMFPLYDTSGKVVGYSGRIYEDDNTSKYINTKETKIFKKGELLYNYHKAKEASRSKDEIIVVEGFMDVIRLYTLGITNVVALMGTSMTKTQANLIKRLSKNVILLFDGDSAGEKATESTSKELVNVGVTPKVIRLEENLDPDEYIIKYGKKIIDKLENPLTLTEFKLNYYKKDKNLLLLEDKAQYINEVIKSLNEIDDEILREITLLKISEESNIDINLLRNKLVSKPNIKTISEKPINFRLNKYDKAQMYLIYYMLNNKEVVKLYNRKVRYIPTNEYRVLARSISKFYEDNQYINEADFLSSLTDEILLETLKKIINLELKEEYSLEEINDYINTIEEYNNKNAIKILNMELKNEVDSEKQLEILKKIAELRGDIND